jgi:ketosteroid isomerase-like protein
MSQENLKIIEGVYAAAAELDKAQLLATLPTMIRELCHEDVEWIEDPVRVDSRTYVGHDGVLKSFEHLIEGFDQYGFELEEAVDCGDKVFVVTREKARGSTSGVPVDAAQNQVFTFRDGKLARFEEFADRRAAEEHAGLRDAGSSRT